MRAPPPSTAAGRCAAPLVSKGEPTAAQSASTARPSSRPGRTSVAERSGIGSTLKVTSVRNPSVPQEPAISFTRSSPVTFFITRPPDFIASPRPLTKRTPMRLSRAAPAMIRRGPEMFAAATAPMVGSPVEPRRTRWSAGSKGSCWPLSASVRTTSDSGVPARAAMTSSAGS